MTLRHRLWGVSLLLLTASLSEANYDAGDCAEVTGTLDIHWRAVLGPFSPCAGIETTDGTFDDASDGTIVMSGVAVTDGQCISVASYAFFLSADRGTLAGYDTANGIPMVLTRGEGEDCFHGHWIDGELDFVAHVAADAFAEVTPPVCGDVNGSASVNTSDALLVLRKGVGQDAPLSCPPIIDLATCSELLTTCAGDLESAGGDLASCRVDAASCQDGLETCQGDVAGCQGGLETCQEDVASCEGDLSTTNADLTTCQAATCGNGTAEYGETCDGAALQGKTCATEALSTPYGTLACNGTCDGFDTSGCKPRFTDNGDGTVTDNSTKLMWEKKTTAVGSGTNYDDPRDVDNFYTWGSDSPPYAPSGTAYTDFLAKLNGGLGAGSCYAGHCDWRLPTIEELQGIVDATQGNCGGASGPCIDAVFGPTRTNFHWSSTTVTADPGNAWGAYFIGAPTAGGSKTADGFVRAVRAGS